MITSLIINNPIPNIESKLSLFLDTAIQSIHSQSLKSDKVYLYNNNAKSNASAKVDTIFNSESPKDIVNILKDVLEHIETPYLSILLNTSFFNKSKLEESSKLILTDPNICMVYSDFEVLSISNGKSMRNFCHPYDVQLYLSGFTPTINSLFSVEKLRKIRIEDCKSYHDIIMAMCKNSIPLHIPRSLHCERTNDPINIS